MARGGVTTADNKTTLNVLIRIIGNVYTDQSTNGITIKNIFKKLPKTTIIIFYLNF